MTESRSAAVASGVLEVGPEVAPGNLLDQPDERERDEREPDEGDEHREPRHPPPPPAHDGGRNPYDFSVAWPLLDVT